MTIPRHYTCHTRSVITKPQNVYVMRDIMCNGYIAGGNTRFFGEKKARENGGRGYTAQNIKDAIEDRLSLSDESTGEYESMLAFAVPYGSLDRRDQVVSITSRLLPWEVNGSASAHDYFPGGANHHKYYRNALNLDSIHFGEDLQAVQNQEFISQNSVNNSLCFIGPHRVYSAFSQTYQELIPGQGHLGPDALPGVSAAPFAVLHGWRLGIATLPLIPFAFFTIPSL